MTAFVAVDLMQMAESAVKDITPGIVIRQKTADTVQCRPSESRNAGMGLQHRIHFFVSRPIREAVEPAGEEPVVVAAAD